ncbi:MAG: roadblock/LC7 domain-containing protein [Ktedonobacterales bacterium]|nr:roadblock/LC7 domain-containing protein [Ktedonobacterales bacterium]
MPNLREILTRLLAVPGVQATVLVGREGLPIEAAGRGDRRFFEMLGALGASALGTTEALGHELGQGTTVGTVLEFEHALVTVDPMGMYAAVVTLAQDAASLARVRHTLRASQEELLRTLDLR